VLPKGKKGKGEQISAQIEHKQVDKLKHINNNIKSKWLKHPN
jgi:hypothetical protein